MRLLLVATMLAIVGCASEPEMMKLPGPPEVETPSSHAPHDRREDLRIDYVGLKQDLGLDIRTDKLGYREKAFNTCDAGRGFLRTANCHREYSSSSNFNFSVDRQRATVTELTEADTQALSNRPIDWLLMDRRGQIMTDSSGYGQILMTYSSSPKQKHIKLNSGRRFLHMEAGDITRVVTPPDWCNR